MKKNGLDKIRRNDKQKASKDKIQKAYRRITETGKNIGIADLMEVYGRYKRLADISEEYLSEMGAKFTFSTSDSST